MCVVEAVETKCTTLGREESPKANHKVWVAKSAARRAVREREEEVERNGRETITKSIAIAKSKAKSAMQIVEIMGLPEPRLKPSR